MTPRRPSPIVSVVAALIVLAAEAALLAAGLGGFAALRAEPRALALVAVWGAAGVALAILRPVRGQDVVRAERDPLVMLALLVLPYAIPFAGARGGALGLARLPHATAVGWAGVALSAAGLALRVAAMRQLGPRFSPLVAVQRTHALETRGLYARVRHPGYAGALLAGLGGAIAFGSGLALPLWALMVVAQAVRVRHEERLLAEQFGDAWRVYVRHTGPLWPGRGAHQGP